MKVAIFYHESFLKHLESYRHVESPERLRAIVNRLKSSPLKDSFEFIQPGPATREQIEFAHEKSYVDSVLSLKVKEPVILDWGDTVATEHSIEAALRAAGAGVEACEMVLEGRFKRAFCAVRPPGHHAERSKAMGFCIFNNIAIAAYYLLETKGFERVAIVDWDVHHGNGTERIFSEDKRVLYISLHQYPHYPGTGSAGFTGIGSGVGYTLNIPMKFGSDSNDYIESFEKKVIPALEDYRPQFLLISAGFDAHEDDPLSGIRLKSKDFGRMTEMVVDVAERHSQGRVVSFLEGGYDVDALAEAVEYHISALAGKT